MSRAAAEGRVGVRRLGETSESDAVSRWSGLHHFVPLTLNTKEALQNEEGQANSKHAKNPSLVTVSHSASGAFPSAPREAQFVLVSARSS